MNSSIAALLIITASSTSAFVQVGPAPQRQLTSSLHATEAFQRSLLEARLGTNAAPAATLDTSPPDADATTQDDQEMFQRSLLEAKLAYDAIDAALDATPAAVIADVPEPAVVVEELAPEPEPVPEPAPEPVVASIPEPEVPKPVMPEPVVVKRVVKRTEFTVPRELAIVPINEATVQFTAGALGAAAGLVLGGPVLGAVGAGTFNYLSRKDEDTSTNASAKKVVDTASQTALLAYNWLAQFEKENKVLNSVFGLLEKVLDKTKELDSPAADAVITLESTLGGIADKVEELNDDYDLVGGAGTVLGSVGDLVEIGLDKVVEVNDEFKITGRVGDVVKGAVEKVTEK